MPDHTLPPDLVMNPVYQQWFTVLTFLAALAAGIYLWRESRKYGSYLPLCIYLGSGIAVVYEPLMDILMMCVYPEQGQWTWIELWERKIPVYLGFTYFFYFPVAIWQFFRQFDASTAAASLWKTAAVLFVTISLFEYVGLALGMWYYYGEQPLRILGLPQFIPFMGLAFLIGPGYALWRIKKYLTGSRAMAAIILTPVFISAFGLSSILVYSAGIYQAPGLGFSDYAGGIGIVIVSMTVLWSCFNTRHLDSDSNQF